MRKSTCFVAIALTMLALVPASQAFVRSTVSTTNANTLFWDLTNTGTPTAVVSGGAVVYHINTAGSDDILDTSDTDALVNAFTTWDNVSTSTMAFTQGAPTTITNTLLDGFFPIFWAESSTTVNQGNLDPSDDVNIAGALAVTFNFFQSSGPEVGELADTNLVFNGVQFQWTTNPVAQPTRIDVESVAVHEIGHVQGLDHTGVIAASLFYAVGAGSILPRDLEADDIAGVSTIYPTAGYLSTTGRIGGNVTTGGSPVFGAHVVALDSASGRTISSAISQSDGSYTIHGLAAGSYRVYAEPLDPVGGSTFLTEQNLGGIYTSAVNINFLTTSETSVSVTAGSTTTQNISVTGGTPALNITSLSPNGSLFSALPIALNPGDSGVSIGVAGPGLPTSGSPLQFTSSSVTVNSLSFGTVGADPAIVANVSVSPSALPGPVGLIVQNLSGQRSYATGGLQIIGSPLPPPSVPQATPSASAPAIGMWGLVGLAVFMAVVSAVAMRRRRVPLS